MTDRDLSMSPNQKLLQQNTAGANENEDSNTRLSSSSQADPVIISPLSIDSSCRSPASGKAEKVDLDQGESRGGQAIPGDDGGSGKEIDQKQMENDQVESSLTMDQLIESHSRFLFGYAYRLSGSVSDSEDLAQQTFLIAHQKLDQLRSRSAAKAWLCAILRSCWLKFLRRNRPIPASNFDLELHDFLIEENRELQFDSQAIQQALDELPAEYRLVLLMFYFEELSYQEIAEQLKVKIGTVMSRLSRAKSKIRSRLKNKDCLLDK